MDDETKQLAATLQDAVKVISEFGAALEGPPQDDGFGTLLPESRLPHSRESIMRATGLLQALLASPTGRAMVVRTLPPDLAQAVLSDAYRKSLEGVPTLLKDFVPDQALQAQQQRTDGITAALKSMAQ